MDDARKPREGEHSVLAQIIAIRLQQLEAQSPDAESFIKQIGVGRGTYETCARVGVDGAD